MLLIRIRSALPHISLSFSVHRGPTMHSYVDLRARHIKRLVPILRGHHEEGSGGHTRLFETVVPPFLCFWGGSRGGLERPRDRYVEHIVPCRYIRELAFRLFDERSEDARVALMIDKLLHIAFITKEEARNLDATGDLKTKMPTGWDWTTGSILERLGEPIAVQPYAFDRDITGVSPAAARAGAKPSNWPIVQLRGGGYQGQSKPRVPRRWQFVAASTR